MKNHTMGSKYEPPVIQVELLEANPDYSYIRYPDGRETTVSNRHLAPMGNAHSTELQDQVPAANTPIEIASEHTITEAGPETPPPPEVQEWQTPRRSGRIRHPPRHLQDYVWKTNEGRM